MTYASLKRRQRPCYYTLLFYEDRSVKVGLLMRVSEEDNDATAD